MCTQLIDNVIAKCLIRGRDPANYMRCICSVQQTVVLSLCSQTTAFPRIVVETNRNDIAERDS